MSKGVFALGLVLLVVGLVLMPFFYPLFGVDSAEDASRKISETVVAAGLELQFKGKITEVREPEWPFYVRNIVIEGLEGSAGDIAVVIQNESLEAGQEVLVDGRYYGLWGVGFIAGSYNETSQSLDPAKIETVPTLMFWLMFIVFIVGIVITVVGALRI